MGRHRLVLTLALVFVTSCAERVHVPADPIAASVDRVVDGDTAWVVLSDGRREKVRFIGVDAPESTNDVEPYGKESAAYAASVLVNGRRVFLELDVDERDRYGRLLAYVWLSPPAEASIVGVRSQMLNGMLIDGGYATLLTVPPNVRYADDFVTIQREARRANRGLWGSRAAA